jgi:hypothetical protein
MGTTTTQRQSGTGRGTLLTAVTYLVLFVLGGLQGMIGSFFYANSPVPLVAIGFVVLIFATCLLAGWGMRTYGAGILAALGWMAASFVLAMPRQNGSVVITATSAGEWYLYGGALASILGAIVALYAWGRHRPRA